MAAGQGRQLQIDMNYVVWGAFFELLLRIIADIGNFSNLLSSFAPEPDSYCPA